MKSKETSEQLGQKILAGIRKATKKLIEQRALENKSLVVRIDGKSQEIPASTLLKSYQ